MELKKRGLTIGLSVSLFLWWQGASLAATTAPTVSYDVKTDIFSPVIARHGMVASADAIATKVGVKVLEEGGNAVDAAVAVGFALAVTHPKSGNLGGGGFMVLRRANGDTTTIDFREVAPGAAYRDMFLDDKGNADSEKSLISPLASGVPGTAAGFALASNKPGAQWHYR